MRKKHFYTSDLAKLLGVHSNTIRLYQDLGFFPPVQRDKNRYRQYTARHIEQAKLISLTLVYPYTGEKSLLENLVRYAAKDHYGMAIELAYQYLAQVRTERTYAESAVEFLERWASGYLMDSSPTQMSIGETAQYLGVTVDMLRNWERNGLIDVPRNPENGYRVYGAPEFGRLRVIRILINAGYSLMAILRMFRKFDSGERENLRDALTIPPEENDSEYIQLIADRWLHSLVELETRAQAVIQQLGHMIEAHHKR